MKKLLKLFSLWLVLSLLFAGFSSASSDCVRRNVWNNSICVAIDKWSSDRYTLDSDITCRDNSCAVSCSILLPDNTLNPVWMCDGKFYYDWNSTERVKLYITINNNFATIEWYYNFRNGTWWDIDDEWWSSSSHSNDDIDISTDDRDPELSEYVDLIIETDDDYAWKVYLSAKYRSSTSNSWSDISNTSSTYFSSTSSAWSNWYVTISSNGYKKISNAFKFAKKWYYRVYAEDKYGNTDYVEFSVEASSSYNDDLELSASTTNPNVWSFVRLTIDTDSDYVGNISFYKVQYKSSTSSSRTTISSRTNSTYFSNYSDEWEDGYYKMKSSDNWHKVISNFLKFAKKGYYRIYAKDTEWNTDYIDFNVWSSSSSDSIEISTNDRNPSTSEYVDLIIETDNDYNWKVYLSAKYRSSTSNSRSDISNTSSTYFSSTSSAWSNWYVTISSNGYKDITNALKFAKKWYYRVYAEDKYGNTDYVEFNVEASSTYNDNLEISASTTSPSAWSFIRFTIDTDSDYVGNINFYKVQYKSSSSDSRSTISRSNSTYFADYSDEWGAGYYKMTSSDRWHKVISNFLKFAKKGYYRIYARDTEWNTDYIDFNVWTYSSDSIEISTNDRNPSTSEYVDLIIETDNDYNWKVYLSAKYRSSTSNSWSDISNTSSTYFSNRSSAWAEWYTTISSNWYKKISDAFKFAKKWYYRIYAEDKYWNTDYIDFNVWTSSSSNSITLETNDDEPKAAEYVDLTVKTNSSYRWKVNFSAKYRSSTSNSWINISRTSSTYFINRSTTWSNWYITMTSSDSWRKTVENIFKFAKKWYYRIIAEDEDGYTTYLDFNVGYSNTSPLDWFTQKEFETIEKIYNVWPTLIRKLRAEYPRIKNSTTWKNMSDELYENMWDVVNKRSNRVFQDYDDFDRAFRRWFTYTQNLMD